MKSKIELSKILNFVGATSLPSNAIIERKQYAQEIRIEPDEERTIIAKISTIDVDRDGDVLIPSGCNTSEIKSNPIVVWNHSYSEPPIGKIIEIQATNDAIYAKMQFAETKFAQEIWSLIKGGFLNACSIGFLAKTTLVKGTRQFSDFVAKNRLKIADTCKRIVTEFTLIENSIVPLPANPNALIYAVATKHLHLDNKLEKELGVNKIIEKKIDYRMYYKNWNDFVNGTVELKANKVNKINYKSWDEFISSTVEIKADDAGTGRWVTTEGGNHIYIDENGVALTGPGGKPIESGGSAKVDNSSKVDVSKDTGVKSYKDNTNGKFSKSKSESLSKSSKKLNENEKIKSVVSNIDLTIDENAPDTRMGQYNAKTGELTIFNSNLSESDDKLEFGKGYTDDGYISNTVTNGNVNAVYRHEVGHAYHTSKFEDKQFIKEWKAASKQTDALIELDYAKKNKGRSTDGIHVLGWKIGDMRAEAYSDHISAYAATPNKKGNYGPKELFAESFAVYTHPDYKNSTKKLPAPIDKFMSKWIG